MSTSSEEVEALEELPSESSNAVFYEKAEKYWSNIDPTLNGVLGGFGWISSADVTGSDKFLSKILNGKDGPKKNRALDCGAGIGRVTKELLLRHFDAIDLVEQNSAFLDEAKRSLCNESKVKNYYVSSLQNFELTERYDVIWCQWVLSHLTDEDLELFLRRCAVHLNPSGLIIIKENVSSDGIVKDEEDSSITRPADHFVRIFRKAALRVIRQAVQTNFPSRLFSVKLFALRPAAPHNDHSYTASLASKMESIHLKAET